MPLVGEFALWIALPIALWGSVLAFLGGTWKRGDLVLSGERSVHAVFALLLVAAAGLGWAFLTDRFEYVYVHSHSSRELDPLLKVVGLWAGEHGSRLALAVSLGLFSTLAIVSNRNRNRALSPFVTGVLLGILLFFLALTLFVTPLFERLPFASADGHGLDARLQNFWNVVHGPIVHLGLAASSIPFSFAMAALILGREEARGTELARPWVLIGWLFLTVGILVGMRRVYGGGMGQGDRLWGPAEIALLLPWLLSTACLYSIRVRGAREILKPGNAGLLILAFLTAMFAFFLPRSGLIGSVEPLAPDRAVAAALLGFMGVAALAALVLLLARFSTDRGVGDPASGSSGGPRSNRPQISEESRALTGLQRWGERTAYLGAVMLAAGLVGSSFGVQVEAPMEPGDSVTVPSRFGPEYTLTYQGLSSQQGRDAWRIIATFSVRRGEGETELLMTERRLYQTPPQPVTEPGIRSFLAEDLYVIVDRLDDHVGIGNDPDFHAASFQIRVRPLVSWIWVGGLLAAAGVMAGLRPAGGTRREGSDGTRSTEPSEVHG